MIPSKKKSKEFDGMVELENPKMLILSGEVMNLSQTQDLGQPCYGCGQFNQGAQCDCEQWADRVDLV